MDRQRRNSWPTWGYRPVTGKDCSEGFVIRNAKSFKTNGGVIPVAENEFNNSFKTAL